MPITLKKDVWKVKDPSSGQYRGAAILSTTLPQDAAQIISESNNTIQNIKDTAIEAVDTALNDESTGLIPKAEADRDAIDDSLNNASNGIIPTAQSDRDDIDDSLNNINDGIIPKAQANLATIAQAVQSQIGQGTDKTLSVAKGFADAKAAGMLVKVSNYQPGSQLDDPRTSQDASQNTGYPVYKDSNRVWVKETYAELEVPTMDEFDGLMSALDYVFPAEYFTQGGLGSNGENYDPRSTSIRTNKYIDISGISILSCVDSSLAFVCLYAGNKSFLGKNAINGNIAILSTLPNFNDAVYFRAELSNTALSDYEKLKYVRKVSTVAKDVMAVRNEVNDIEGKVETKMLNGSLANSGNPNIVHTDFILLQDNYVEFVVDRPVTEGYYYIYSYNIYDSNKNMIARYDDTYTPNKNYAFASESGASYIAFNVEQTDGTNHRSLRETDFTEYSPHVKFPYLEYYSSKFIETKTPDNLISGYPNYNTNTIVNSGNQCVGFVCSENTEYNILKKKGNRFAVLFLKDSLSKQFFDYIIFNNADRTAKITTPNGAWYMIIYIDTGPMADAADVVELKSVITKDSYARRGVYEAKNAIANMFVDSNAANLWTIGGLGSNGENYDERQYGIRTERYIDAVRNAQIEISAGHQIRLAQYGENNSFISRVVYKESTILLMNVLDARAKKIRIEINLIDEQGIVITTPFVDTSEYTGIKLLCPVKFINSDSDDDDDNSFNDVYADLISQARYIYSSSDSGVSSYSSLTLLHCTDLHGNKDGMDFVLKIYRKYQSKIDAILHTGDVVTANLSDGIANWISSGCAEVVLNTIGNHDTEENFVLQAAGKDNVYNTIFAPYISNWDVVQPTGVADSTSPDYHALYYYKDFATPSVRLIVLDTNFWDAAEKSWLTSVLNDALTNSLCVVIACHNVKKLTEMTDSNFSAYPGNGIDENTNAYGNQPVDWLDPVQDFIDAGGNFACILAGHNHSGHMGTMTNYPDIFVYVADKSSMNRVSGTARISGEVNQNTVSIVTINPVEKLFKIVKIGAEVDGKMRGKHVFCYDYANKRIISQW